MASYVCTSRTNYFRVTDEEKFQEMFTKLYCAEASKVEDFTKEVDGVTLHAFGAYGEISYAEISPEEEDSCIRGFLEALQPILPGDEAFILFEVGNEKLRYLTGDATIVTATQIKYVDLESAAIDAARKVLGPDFSTVCQY